MNRSTAVTQKVTQNPGAKRHSKLTAKGGIGLVSFHLARLGHEFALTGDDCHLGDIWAQVGDRKVGIEVKTTRKDRHWHAKRAQVDRVDFYCLVFMMGGVVYVLTAAEMAEVMASAPNIYPGIALIAEGALPDASRNAWSKLQGQDYAAGNRVVWTDEALRAAAGKSRERRGNRSPRVVRRILANGETKEYVYPPYRA